MYPLKMLVLTLSLLLVSESTFAAKTCESLFKPTLWSRIRNSPIIRRNIETQTEFVKMVKKSGKSENVLIGRIEDGKFILLGWADFIGLDAVNGVASVTYQGETLAVGLSEIFVFGHLGKMKAMKTFVVSHEDISNFDKPPFYLFYGFSPNGMVLLESTRARAKTEKGFDTRPVEDVVVYRYKN